jgi:hypothetical protein
MLLSYCSVHLDTIAACLKWGLFAFLNVRHVHRLVFSQPYLEVTGSKVPTAMLPHLFAAITMQAQQIIRYHRLRSLS